MKGIRSYPSNYQVTYIIPCLIWKAKIRIISPSVHILDKDTTNHRVREAKPEMHFPFICKSGQKRTRALFPLILPLGFDEITLLDGNGRTSFRHVERIHDGKTVYRCLLVSPVQL